MDHHLISGGDHNNLVPLNPHSDFLESRNTFAQSFLTFTSHYVRAIFILTEIIKTQVLCVLQKIYQSTTQNCHGILRAAEF